MNTNREHKLKLLPRGKRPSLLKVRATDCDGNVETFDSPDEVAAYFHISKASVYARVYDGKKVRGCILEKIT